MSKVDEYKVNADGVPAHIQLKEEPESFVLRYEVNRPEIKTATEAVLKDLKEQIVRKVDLSTEEFVNSREIETVRQKFRDQALELLEDELPETNEQAKKILIGNLIHEMLGLGDIEILLNDENLEEIVINSADEPVWVYHKEEGWLKSDVEFKDDDEIKNYASDIGRRVGKNISSLHPLLDAHLPSGDRTNATLYPISTQGNTITIRKFARDPWTITDFVENGTVSKEVAAFLWLCMQYEMNVLVSGGTGAGKTSMLNVLMPFIPPSQRILSIEDTREVQLPEFLHWVPLTTREPNPEGKGGVSMLDLLVNALRMRPDRILVGEIRRKRQAEVLFEAMHTGHSVYSTLHADTAEQTVRRLINPPINVPKTMVEAVDVNLVMFRDRRRNFRRAMELAEISLDEETEEVEANVLYEWQSRNDEMEKKQESSSIYETLRMHAGMTDKEIDESIQEKKEILDWMIENDVNEVDTVGTVVAEYYDSKEDVVEVVKENGDLSDISRKEK
ncbi:type II/IV secretion system ATPase subunit [Candidatus Nanohalococcus occultus]|uniref:Pilus assembly protein, ATPase of CpaF family n=1 Tax=Candidatus Nanohalococcus occultus TaxID=2978047 RepID=A0ABY8CDJ4_9ARCH|nr:Pilus assembly protein, ATPase of CpaF family [Candidatus Nanohaloarchaeota archaeon SVXNc]